MNFMTEKNVSPLILAARNGHQDVVNSSQTKGLSQTWQIKMETLHQVMLQGEATKMWCNSYLIERLSQNWQINEMGILHYTGLHPKTTQMQSTSFQIEGLSQTLQNLLGSTPLSYALKRGHRDIVNILTGNGGSVQMITRKFYQGGTCSFGDQRRHSKISSL